MTKRNSRREIRKQTRILALIIVGLIVLIIGLVVFQLTSEKAKQDAKVVIVLDNAHGGDASGNQGIISEDEYNEKVIDALAAKLEAGTDYTVVRTHQDGQAMAVSTRVEVINNAKADLVLSVRCHDGMSPNFTNTMIFAQPAVSKYHAGSVAFAKALEETFQAREIACTTGYFYNHPIKAGYFQEHLVPLDDETDYQEETYDLMNAEAPVVIVSQINVNSQEDVDAWATDEGYEQIADLYCKAIRSVFK